MSRLRISLLQSDLQWEDPKANCEAFEKKINALEPTDLIILPEMFTTGFSMASSTISEKMDGESIGWMKTMAAKRGAVICGSLIIEDAGNYFNRLIWMRPDGRFEQYDKRHLFRMADEDQHFSQGNEKLIVELKGWKICPLICYDLRFPVWSRNTYDTDRKTYANASYDLLIYIANWPSPRATAWSKLLMARAIENQVYVAAVNRIGRDEKQIDYIGGSAVIDAKGDALWEAANNTEESVTIEIDKDSLDAFRKKFPLGMDADDFKIT
ncbi:MAG: amidohydrolase [Flavobacteriales bacterium]|nr:amidohydrolase [Flavobacteriales bacterium]|tara:strand:- start:433 stop:1236 length:804 start_codon:yes stop_codon:yes gene_type:complete